MLAAGPASAEEAVAIVDLRAPSAVTPGADGFARTRAALAEALDARPGIRVLRGEAGDALAGIVRDADDVAAAAALAEAREAFGALDCGRARPAAEEAVLLLAGRAAAGLDERARLGPAWTYVLLCADRDGDGPMARAAADRLRALGATSGVPADLWTKYPEIDAATDRDILELEVRAEAGARIEVDHVAGAGKRFVASGKHVVAVADGTVRGAMFVTVLGKPLAVDVPVAARDGAWRDVAGRVLAWRGGPPSASELTELMTRVDVRFAVVLGGGGIGPALWVRGTDDATAHRAEGRYFASDAPAGGDVAGLADAIAARVALWSDGGPDPDRPLLTEADAPRRRGRDDRIVEPTRWWVYAAIGGALAAGALTIYALDAGEDRQRIELTFP